VIGNIPYHTTATWNFPGAALRHRPVLPISVLVRDSNLIKSIIFRENVKFPRNTNMFRDE